MADKDFFLGKRLDGDEPLTLDPDDLTTHAVIVGMTGSGKTGLGIVLLEEALSRGIPALILDPKGDMGNLALTFPDLSAASFRALDRRVDCARRRPLGGRLRGADRDPLEGRTRRVRARARPDPGAARRGRGDALHARLEAGVPLNVIGSLDAPTLSWDRGGGDDPGRDRGDRHQPARARRDRRRPAWQPRARSDREPARALLARGKRPRPRLSDQPDPDAAAAQARRLRGGRLHAAEGAQRAGDALNALAASPSFAAWGRGPALDPRVLLRTEDGRPRAAVVYLAHLSDQERQLVVTLVLSRLITWMHEQPGTSELRALVYLDEVFGFAPPTAAPPSKKPILTLMKQARAFGIGMVVATQNPVDLDYKAMANAGSWFVGRLQTENDKERVLEGLRSAAGGVDVDKLDKAIGGLEQRQFLLQSAHRAEPVLFSTRWAMSFLRGPLTKDQIETLTPDEARTAPAAPTASRRAGAARRPCALRRRERRRARRSPQARSSAISTRRRRGRPRSAPCPTASGCGRSSPRA